MNTSIKTTLLFLSAILFTTQYAVSDSNDDKKTTIQIGKSSKNLDDVRLGNYVLKTGDPVSSDAAKELQILLKALLKFQKQDASESILLKDLVVKTQTVLPTLQKKQSDNTILWNSENQKALDEQIQQNYAELQQMDFPNETHALIGITYAQHLFINKKNTEGIAILKSIIQNFSGNQYEIRARGKLVYRLFLSKKYSDVKNEANAILEKYPNAPEAQDALYFRGRVQYETKQYNEAIKDFDAFITKNPESNWTESAKYFRGKTNSILNNNEMALVQLDDFINSYPNSIYRDDARELMANIYGNQQNFEKAIEMFELYKKENHSVFEQIAAESRITQYASTLSRMGLSKKDSLKYKYYDSIVTSFPKKITRILKDYPDSNPIQAQSLFSLFNYYHSIEKNLDKSIEILQTILNNPKYLTETPDQYKLNNCENCDRGLLVKSWVEYNLVLVYTEKGDFDKTAEYKNSVLKDNNSSLYWRLELTEIETRYKNKTENSLTYFETSLKRISEIQNLDQTLRARALFLLADIYSREKKENEALKLYDKIVKNFANTIYAKASNSILKYYNMSK
jgi:outer membrane protein assembly factor BamD (BamD/ComL family)